MSGPRLRDHRGETLFIDARKLGTLIDHVHRELTDADIEKITSTDHALRGVGLPPRRGGAEKEKIKNLSVSASLRETNPRPADRGRGPGVSVPRLRDHRGETLFIDARKLGTLIDRVHRELTDADIEKITSTYHAWRGVGLPQRRGGAEKEKIKNLSVSASLREYSDIPAQPEGAGSW